MDEFTSTNQVTVASFYREVTDPNARALLDFLIEHPGERFDARAIMTALDFAQHRDVALAAYAVGEVAGQHGCKRPWFEAQLGYQMSPEVAVLLQRMRG